MKYPTIISKLQLSDREYPALFNNSSVSSKDNSSPIANDNTVVFLGA